MKRKWFKRTKDRKLLDINLTHQHNGIDYFKTCYVNLKSVIYVSG